MYYCYAILLLNVQSEEDKRRVDQESLARTNVFSPDKK